MPEPLASRTKSFSSSGELQSWLEENHTSADELWVKIFKKKSGVPSVTWDDVVIECLCWGWIDGIKKSHCDQTYLQRITPRRKRSMWSKRNCEHAERLICEGRMQDSGMEQVLAAKNDGRWDNAYSVSDMEIPDDFIHAVNSNRAAKETFDSLSKSSRYVIAHSLLSARRPDTRQRRFSRYLQMMIDGQKP
jgi:uncharacterized protein YdeI (YjbR/CyaY-like superfamily)